MRLRVGGMGSDLLPFWLKILSQLPLSMSGRQVGVIGNLSIAAFRDLVPIVSPSAFVVLSFASVLILIAALIAASSWFSGFICGWCCFTSRCRSRAPDRNLARVPALQAPPKLGPVSPIREGPAIRTHKDGTPGRTARSRSSRD